MCASLDLFSVLYSSQNPSKTRIFECFHSRTRHSLSFPCSFILLPLCASNGTLSPQEHHSSRPLVESHVTNEVKC